MYEKLYIDMKNFIMLFDDPNLEKKNKMYILHFFIKL